MKTWRLGLLALLAFSLGGCESAPPPIGKRVGDQAPEVSGEDVDGKIIRLSDYKGKVVLLDFWGTWCPPCRQLIPHEIQKVTKDYKDRPFALIGIASDDPATLKEFLAVRPLPWPNIVDATKLIVNDWGVDVFPTFVLIDHHGIVRRHWNKGVTREAPEVWKEVEKYVQQAEVK
jgi:peroxiredoxin